MRSSPPAHRSALARDEEEKRSRFQGLTVTCGADAARRTRVAQRLGLVRAPAQRREDPLDRVAQLRLGREAGVGAFQAPGALDPHRRGPVDHDLLDLGVAQQRLQRPQPERALGHPRDQRLAVGRVEQRRLALHQLAVPACTSTAAPCPASSARASSRSRSEPASSSRAAARETPSTLHPGAARRRLAPQGAPWRACDSWRNFGHGRLVERP